MSRKIEELTIEEAKELIDKITLSNRKLEVEKIGLRKERDSKLDEKKKIQEAKSKKMKSQKQIVRYLKIENENQSKESQNLMIRE